MAVSTYLTGNSPVGEICLFSLFVHLFNHLCEQGLLDICFRLWGIVQFCIIAFVAQIVSAP